MEFAIESSGCTSSWQRTFDRPHVRSEDRGWWWTLALGLRLESFSALHEGLKSIEASLFAGQTWGQGRTVFMQRTVLRMARHFKRQWHYKSWAEKYPRSLDRNQQQVLVPAVLGFIFLVQQDCWVWNPVGSGILMTPIQTWQFHGSSGRMRVPCRTFGSFQPEKI